MRNRAGVFRCFGLMFLFYIKIPRLLACYTLKWSTLHIEYFSRLDGVQLGTFQKEEKFSSYRPNGFAEGKKEWSGEI